MQSNKILIQYSIICNLKIKNNMNSAIETPSKPTNSNKFNQATQSTAGPKSPPRKPSDQQEPKCYSWHSIDYRDCKYVGKVLMTQYGLKNKNVSLDELPHIHKLPSSNYLDYHQYRHGPGILAFDQCIWIVANWSYDHLVGNLLVVGPDLSIMQCFLDERQSEDAFKVEQVCYLGSSTKDSLGTDKFMLLGSLEQGNMWKWVTDLHYTTNRINKDKNNEDVYYYLKTISKEVGKTVGRRGQKQEQFVKFVEQLKSQKSDKKLLDKLGQFGSYNYLMNSIKSMLIQPNKSSKPDEGGFTASEKLSYYHQQMFLHTRITSSGSTSQSIHIQLSTLLNRSPNPKQSSADHRKDREGNIKNINDCVDILNVGIIGKKFRKQEDALWLNRYRIEAVDENKVKVRESIRQGIHQHEYQYSLKSNIIGSEQKLEKQHHLCLKHKQQQHLCSLNFVNKSCQNISLQVKELLKLINTVYQRAKIFEAQSKKGSNLNHRFNILKSPPINHNQSRVQNNHHRLSNIFDKNSAYINSPKNKLSRQDSDIQYLDVYYNKNKINNSESKLSDIKRQLNRINQLSLGKRPGKKRQSPNRLQRTMPHSLASNYVAHKNIDRSMRLRKLYQSLAQLSVDRKRDRSNEHSSYIMIEDPDRQTPKFNQIYNTFPHEIQEVEQHDEHLNRTVNYQATRDVDPELNQLIKQYSMITMQMNQQGITPRDCGYQIKCSCRCNHYKTSTKLNPRQSIGQREERPRCVYEVENPERRKYCDRYKNIVHKKIEDYNREYKHKDSVKTSTLKAYKKYN